MEIPAAEKGKDRVTNRSVRSVHFLSLLYSSTMTNAQRSRKRGLFIGQQGEHIRLIEKTCQVRINLVNHVSHKSFLRTISRLIVNSDESTTTTRGSYVSRLWVLLISTATSTDQDQVDQAKDELKKQWTNMPDPVVQHPTIIPEFMIESSLDFSQDTRWKPKNRQRHERKQRKLERCTAVEPQPSFAPLTMPQSVSKSRGYYQRK